MADEGVKLTSFYAGAPLCAPSRVSLMTGCYPQRPSIYNIDDHKHFHPILHNEEVTLAEMLKSAGYSTMAIGKWHLAGGGHQAVDVRRGRLPEVVVAEITGNLPSESTRIS